MTFAAGAAAEGLHPVVAVYSTFLQRAYDQILIDVCMQDLPVTFCLDRAGVVGADGETHHGIFDISYLLPMPNLTVFCPVRCGRTESCAEIRCLVGSSRAVRYPRGNGSGISERNGRRAGRRAEARENLFHSRILKKRGTDVTIVSAGAMTADCIESCRILEAAGIRAELIDARVLKPLDAETLRNSAAVTGLVFTVEDNVGTEDSELS